MTRRRVLHLGLVLLLAGCGAAAGGASEARFSPTSAQAFNEQQQQGRFVTPQWARDAVFYQIFPERFFNGDHGNDPPDIQPWGGQPTYYNFFGGDLRGVIQKLSYLRELGVTALYLNPIFESPSNHKYNASDYLKIDPHFGDLATFRELVQKCHQQGIRLILDGVFNHTGDKFWAFQDIVKNGRNSPYWSWYTVFSWPIVTSPQPNYKAWWGFGELPVLVNTNPEVRNHLLNKVVDFWTREGIDGWRLDVPNEYPHDFSQLLRQKVKELNPDAYIVGEIWQDASPWLQGSEFDSAMNYVWRDILFDFFVHRRIDVDTFDARLAELRQRYPAPATQVMFNLLDSHDTPRYLTDAGNDLAALKQAALLQMTYPGTPVVYYGDEIGMQGGKDPDNRHTMAWDSINQGLLSYYKKLIAIRRSYSALRSGEFMSLMRHNDNRIYAYVRSDATARLVILLNEGNERAVTLDVSSVYTEGTALTDSLTGKSYSVRSGTVTLNVGGRSGVLLAPAPAARSAARAR